MESLTLNNHDQENSRKDHSVTRGHMWAAFTSLTTYVEKSPLYEHFVLLLQKSIFIRGTSFSMKGLPPVGDSNPAQLICIKSSPCTEDSSRYISVFKHMNSMLCWSHENIKCCVLWHRSPTVSEAFFLITWRTSISFLSAIKEKSDLLVSKFLHHVSAYKLSDPGSSVIKLVNVARYKLSRSFFACRCLYMFPGISLLTAFWLVAWVCRQNREPSGRVWAVTATVEDVCANCVGWGAFG